MNTIALALLFALLFEVLEEITIVRGILRESPNTDAKRKSYHALSWACLAFALVLMAIGILKYLWGAA